MTKFIDEAAVRKRAWHYLSPEVAAWAGMTLDQLKQFVAGTLLLTPDEIMRWLFECNFMSPRNERHHRDRSDQERIVCPQRQSKSCELRT